MERRNRNKSERVAQLSNELHRKIGRNLLRFQRIELEVKFMLPYIHPKGSKSGLDAFKKVRKQNRKKSLRELLNAFTESIEVEGISLNQMLRKAVRARNELVHRLLHVHAEHFMTLDGVEHVIAELDKQFAEAATLAELTHDMSAALLLAIAESSKDPNGYLARHRNQILAKLSPGVEIIAGRRPAE